MKGTVLLLFFVWPVHAEQSNNTLKLVTEIYPPFQYVNEQNQLAGYAVETLTLLCKQAQLSCPITVYPWARAYRLAETHKNTAIFSMAKTPSRLDMFIWGHLLVSESHYYLWKKKGGAVNEVITDQNFLNYAIAASRDSAPSHYLQHKGHQTVYLVSDFGITIDMLITERAMLVMATLQDIATLDDATQAQLEQVLAIKEVDKSLYYAFNKDTDVSIINRVERAYQILSENGELQQLQKKWAINISQ